jgi:hypothetical protein
VRTKQRIDLSTVVKERRREFDSLAPRVLDPRHKAPETKRASLWRRMLAKLSIRRRTR